MLQFITQTNSRYSIAETVQMAIEGGCRWIQLHLPNLSDADIRELAPDIIDMCRESAVFLMLEDRPDLAKELGLHGVHLSAGCRDRSAASVREELGPEAVIGVETGSADAVMALRNADIDYVSLPADMSLDDISRLVSTVRETEIAIPIVAAGDIAADDAAAYMAAGVSGIATGMPQIMAHDPVEAIARTLAQLNAHSN